MSLEPGGRCDKLGNAYEDRYFANLMLRLIQEEKRLISCAYSESPPSQEGGLSA